MTAPPPLPLSPPFPTPLEAPRSQIMLHALTALSFWFSALGALLIACAATLF